MYLREIPNQYLERARKALPIASLHREMPNPSVLTSSNGPLWQLNVDMGYLILYCDQSLVVCLAYQYYLQEHGSLMDSDPSLYTLLQIEAHYFLENYLFRVYAFLERGYQFANQRWGLGFHPREVRGDKVLAKETRIEYPQWGQSRLCKELMTVRGTAAFRELIHDARHELTHKENPHSWWRVGFEITPDHRLGTAVYRAPDRSLEKAIKLARLLLAKLYPVLEAVEGEVDNYPFGAG